MALASLATGCVEEMPEVIEEVQLSNLLTPSSTAYAIDAKDGSTVTFTWTNSKAANYHLEVYAFETEDENTPDDAMSVTDEILASVPDNMKFSYDVAPAESGSTSSHTVKFDPELSLYARVCAQSSADPDTKTTGDSKWAVFKYPIETYTVMDPVASVTVTGRTENSITISWTLEDGDETGINQVRVYDFGTDDLQAYTRVNVENPTEKENSSVISNLSPSTKYTVAVHYNSANRGQQFVWTTPSWEGVAPVSTAADLKQALIDAGSPAPENEGTPLRIQLTNLDTPYDLGGYADILGPVEILGAQSPDGSRSPKVIGGFCMVSPTEAYQNGSETVRAAGASYVRLEAIELDGNAYSADRPLKHAKGSHFTEETPVSAYIINCDIHSYKSGVYYDGDEASTAKITEVIIDNNIVTDIQGASGDGFDLRQVTSADNIEITNNTFDGGYRDFIRIDNYATGGTTVNSFLFDHNTVNAIGVDSGKRVFYVRAAVPSFIVSDNIFMNIEKSIFMYSDSKATLPTELSGNFFYHNTAEGFFEEVEEGKEPSDEFTQDIATAGGGAVVSSDPCYNSGRSIFNVTNAAILEAGAGDPRWLVDYIVPVEPELSAVNESDEYKSTGSYTWNLTDLDTFYESIESKCRLGNIQFYIDGTPVTVDEEGFHFTGEATTEYSGVPVDGALAFLVSEPGSVVISTQASGSTNDHITVAYGPADGSSAAVEGAIAADANGSRVVFPDIETPTMIYLYACGPITMTTLSWISDVTTIGPSKLDTPENLTLSVTDPVDDSFTGDVTLSWNPVTGAGSYEVSVYGPVADKAMDLSTIQPSTISVTEPSYAFSPTSLESGVYLYAVQAFPASGDATHENSDVTPILIGESPTLVRTETLEPVSANIITTWGHEEFLRMQQIAGTDANFTPVWESIVHNNLEYVSNTKEGRVDKDRTIRFSTSDNLVCFQTPGGSNNPPDRRYLKFLASGNGSLKVTFDATSTGRHVLVSVAGTVLDTQHEASTEERNSFTETITATEGDPIIVFADASLRIFEVSWTPEGYDPNATIPSDNAAIEETYITDFEKDASKYSKILKGESLTVDKITYVALDDKDMDFDAEKFRYKFGGTSKLGENSIPTFGYASFKVTKPGIITHKVISSSSSPEAPDPERKTVIVLAKYNEGQLSGVIELYNEDAPLKSSADPVETPITQENLAGTRETAVVYVYSLNGAVNIYQLGYTPAQ